MSIGITKATLDFEAIREIGQQGRNSQVFLAHDKQLDAEIVIKKIEKIKILNALEYFTEARKLYDSEHQHVVQIKYACEDSDYVYLAMPYYKHGSIKTLIDFRFLTVREIIRFGTQFLSGLHNIHVKKLIHFDVKPDNILVSDANEALLSDFGLSKNMNALGLSTPDLFYPKHIPPEVFSQSVHSMLYDIYNAGLTLYRMCNGNDQFNLQFRKYPDQGSYESAIMKGTFPDRDEYLPHIPKNLRKVINKALMVNQADRHQTVLELVNELSPIDNLLDWQYEIKGADRTWTLKTDEKIIVVNLTTNGSLFDIETTRTILATNRKTRVIAGCITGVTNKTVNKQIQNILLQNEG